MPATPIAELDFARIKNDLKTFLQNQDVFKDYDFEGSSMSVLLDVLAYNTFNQNFYANMALSEMFLDSAQLRSSVLSHAKELNYLPRSYSSARSDLTIRFDAPDDTSFITVPKYTKFSAQADGRSFTFMTDKTYTILPENGFYTIGGVRVYEGKQFTEYFRVTNGIKYTLSNSQIDTSSVEVKVFASDLTGASNIDYVFSPNLFGVEADGKVFYLQPSEEGRYEVTFGRNVFGREPEINEIVEITYRITSGEEANGAFGFNPESTIDGLEIIVEQAPLAEGGASEESIESIKFNAPKSIQVQERCITESDYEILLKSKFPEIQAISVYGGEELNPPKYGKVVVSVDTAGGEGVSLNSQNAYTEFLSSRCPLAIEPIVMAPEFIHAKITSTVYVNTSINGRSLGAIEASVRNSIINFSDTYLNDFKKNLRSSRLIRAIDDSDSAIVSNDTEILMIIDINPEIGEAENFAFSFKNPLIVDHPLYTGEDITIHRPAIKSSNFDIGGNSSYIQDNGNGVLQILSNTPSGFIVLNSNLGTVDYNTGRIVIRKLNVDGYSGEAIKIYGRMATNDILGPKERILSIRASDIDVSIESARQ